MQISRYYYHSNRNTFIATFIKRQDIINIYIDYVGNEQVLKLVITEDRLKNIPSLWLCYIVSILLTKDTNNNECVIFIKKNWKNLYITDYYEKQEIDISNIDDVLSREDDIESIIEDINNYSLINEKILHNILENKLNQIDKVLIKCELNVEK